MNKKVLIIGAGPAGLYAAEAAAVAGAAVLLCGGEPYPPYWRPRLTRWLSQPVPAEQLAIKKPEWYAERGIRLLTGKTAERIDPASKQVQWADGSTDGYDALVLAAGAEPNLPKIPGVGQALTLRTFDDAVRLRQAALAVGRAVIVGGGLLGIETTWELNAAGVRTALVERNSWLMPRQLDREGGQYLQRALESKGISFSIGIDPAELGRLYAGACVVLAAGVRASLSFLHGSGIAANKGIVVDDHMRTSAPDVFACGDIAEYRGQCWGLMPIAEAQGRAAGANAAGGDAVYVEAPPSPMLKAGDVSVFSVGDIAEDEGILSIREETAEKYRCIKIRDGVLAGAVLIGDTKAGMKLKKAVAEKKKLTSLSTVEDVIGSI